LPPVLKVKGAEGALLLAVLKLKGAEGALLPVALPDEKVGNVLLAGPKLKSEDDALLGAGALGSKSRGTKNAVV